MKNTKNAFTLVELIVVITILAVLGTIAFVSLQGYSRDAKNSKVTADVRTLVSGVETALTDGTATMSTVVTEVSAIDTRNSVTAAASGAVVDTKAGVVVNTVDLDTATNTSYKVGTVNFAGIKQNGDDFKDNDGNQYVAASVFSGSIAAYQVAGELTDASGGKETVLKGNFVKNANAAATAGSLLSASGVTTPLSNGGSATLY